MTLTEFVATVTRYIARALGERFSGKITITINANKGGIGSVQVATQQELTKE
jgi:hypothetical protein